MSFLKLICRIIGLDRRRDERLVPSCAVECKCEYIESGKIKEFSAGIVDVSKGGILLMTNDEKIYPKTALKIRFELSTNKKPIFIHGSIIRTYREEGQDWYYSAVKFAEIDEEGVRLLLDGFPKDKNKRTGTAGHLSA